MVDELTEMNTIVQCTPDELIQSFLKQETFYCRECGKELTDWNSHFPRAKEVEAYFEEEFGFVPIITIEHFTEFAFCYECALAEEADGFPMYSYDETVNVLRRKNRDYTCGYNGFEPHTNWQRDAEMLDRLKQKEHGKLNTVVVSLLTRSQIKELERSARTNKDVRKGLFIKQRQKQKMEAA